MATIQTDARGRTIEVWEDVEEHEGGAVWIRIDDHHDPLQYVVLSPEQADHLARMLKALSKKARAQIKDAEKRAT